MTRLRRIVLNVVCGLASALGTGSALGWNRPVHIRAAEDAKRFVAESKKHHADARVKIDHANAMWKAKAALAEAESAAAISTP